MSEKRSEPEIISHTVWLYHRFWVSRESRRDIDTSVTKRRCRGTLLRAGWQPFGCFRNQLFVSCR